MHYVEDLSCQEIAQVLGTSAGAVRVRLHRARRELRRELAPLAPLPLAVQTKELTMVEMKVEDVVVRVAADDASEVADEFGAIVLLKERAGERSMPIFVGLTEGATLAARVAGDSFPRPTAADLMVDLVRVAGGRIERVVISSIRDNTFYAAISINGEEVDARPSDAIGLAVRIGAPIVLDEGLLTEHGLAGLELVEWLEREAARVGYELPPGEWRSLSAELMHSLGARRLDKLPGQVRTER